MTGYNPCRSNPCKNDATCQWDGSTLECECKKDYYGKRCTGTQALQTVHVQLERTLRRSKYFGLLLAYKDVFSHHNLAARQHNWTGRCTDSENA